MSASIDGPVANLVGPVVRDQERDLRPGAGLSLELVESKLHPPPTLRKMVPRTVLVDRLLAPDAAPVVCVVAPAGYGKTTLLAQWAGRKGDRVAWVEIDRGDNDPAVLLTYVAVALDRIERIDPGIFRALASVGAGVPAVVVARLAAAISAMKEPVALVLDHVELLGNQQGLDAVAQLAAQLPSGSKLFLASRATPPLPVGLLRAEGVVMEIGVQELAMDQREARALLKAAGLQLGDAEATELLRRTEGWPAGLYLAALALKAGDPPSRGGTAFSGDDRFMVDYVWSELLSRHPQPTVAFLIRTSVLDRMSGPLCDTVLDTIGSADTLESLERSDLLLVPLDRHRQWYRYHHLFHEFLRAELTRREPELVPQLHARAAAWCEANGLPETAIAHAQAAGDADRAARLVAILMQPAYASGRAETARRWLAWFEDQELIQRYPSVAVQGAWLEALVGQPAAAERWADAAEWESTDSMLADDSTKASHLALLRALLCRDGMERMRADAQAAAAGLSPASPWLATALLLEGISYLLEGQAGQADPILVHAVQVATDVGATPAAAAGQAERAIVAMERGKWPEAGDLAEQALASMRAGRLDDYAMSPLVHAVAARTAAHRGDAAAARAHLAGTAPLRPLLTYAMPHRAVQTLLELGDVYLTLGEAATARMVLREARNILLLRPNLGILPRRANELHSRLDTISGQGVAAMPLTSAELRLLPLLATHLSFPEIGDRLYLSRHTVKSQAISLYRKLGVASRSEAVTRAQQLGLDG